jgi:hypothetical protein
MSVGSTKSPDFVRSQAHRVLRKDFDSTLDNRSVKMIRKLKSGEYRLYSKKKDPKTGKRKNLGTFKSLEAAKKHEQEVEFFKRRK